MDAQELRNLQEAYMEVVENQQLDEAYVDFAKDRKDSLGRPKLSPRGKALTKAMSSLQPNPMARHRDDEKNKGRSEKIKTAINSFDSKKVQAKSVANKERGENKKKAFGNRLMRSDKQGIRDSYDYYDIILSHLLDEGYAETPEAAESIMVNMSEEWRQDIMEISQKTATRAYAASRSGEFEGADSDRDLKRSDNLEKHIKRKFGDEAVKHAERAADAETFGRRDASGRRKQRPQPRIQPANKYRTTKDGKMHGQDQNALKTKLQRRRGEEG